MKDFDRFIHPSPGFIGGGDVVLFNRLEMFRNISLKKFPPASDDSDLIEIKELASLLISGIIPELLFLDMSDLSIVERKYLKERLVLDSYNLTRTKTGALFVDEKLLSGIRINSINHLEFFILCAGMCSKEKYDELYSMVEKVGTVFMYAHSDKFGYLAPMLENIGAGVKISYYLRLPAFILLGKIGLLKETVRELGINLTPLSSGEQNLLGSGIFVIDNVINLSAPVFDVACRTRNSIEIIVEHEKRFREELFTTSHSSIKDKVMKTVGMLKYASLINPSEMGTAIFTLLLGAEAGLLPFSVDDVLSVYYSTGRFFLELISVSKTSDDISKLRADALRKLLQNV